MHNILHIASMNIQFVSQLQLFIQSTRYQIEHYNYKMLANQHYTCHQSTWQLLILAMLSFFKCIPNNYRITIHSHRFISLSIFIIKDIRINSQRQFSWGNIGISRIFIYRNGRSLING